MSPLALGLDLGSSGLRLALLTAEASGAERLLQEESAPYPAPFEQPQGWLEGLITLTARLDPELRRRIGSIAIAGTSGTLLCCRPDGTLLPGAAGLALPYHRSCSEHAEQAREIAADPDSPAAGASGSLARALWLLAGLGDAGSVGQPGPAIVEADPTASRAGMSAGAVRPEGPGPDSMAGGGEPADPARDHAHPGLVVPGARFEAHRLGGGRDPRDAAPGTPPDQAAGAGRGAGPRADLGAGPRADDAAEHASERGVERGAEQRELSSGQRPPQCLLRHQADWLMGWLLGDWRWGEEGNNLRLGWDLERGAWSGTIASQPWAAALPTIRPSGSVIGRLGPEAAERLGLNPDCVVVAGSTDANAGVLAADPQEGDGITVLGTTLVLKQFVAAPIRAAGVSCHRVAGRWLVGGASNAGAGILRRFFSDEQIGELSRQIDPRRPSGLALLPLPARGERFPVDDPLLEPRLEPRPVSDALYLQALLEGLTRLEVQGWQRLRELGAPPLRRVITLGGGARNPQWRSLRQQALGVPVLQRPGLSAALGMARLALRAAGRMEACPLSDA